MLNNNLERPKTSHSKSDNSSEIEAQIGIERPLPKKSKKTDIVDLISRGVLSFFSASFITGLYAAGLSKAFEINLNSEILSHVSILIMTIIFWNLFSKWGWFKNRG